MCPARPDRRQSFDIAVEHQKAGRYREAEEICRGLLKQNPRDLLSLALLGSIARIRGDIPKATQLFKEALRLDPDFVPAIGNLGDICRMTGRYPEALHWYERVAQLDPGNLMAVFNMGAVYLVLARYEDAIARFRRVLAVQSNLAAAHANIGYALMELGRIDEAKASFEKALVIEPDLSDAHYNMHAAVFDENNIAAAISSLEAALAGNPDNHEARAYLAMYLDFAGDTKTAEEHFSLIENKALPVFDKLDSWRYVKSHLHPGVRLFAATRPALEYSFSKAKLTGLVLEFGVRSGASTNILARQTDQDIHGFDSFEGLPEQWEGMPKGALSTFNQLPRVPDHVHLHAGWFEDTLPGFVEQHAGPVRFMNVDCDIYSSTKTVFHYLNERIVPGTVIIFDEYICNPAWRENEYKAFQEFIAETGHKYEYLLFSPFSKQAAVIITS